jgi:hypothetical protein
LGAGEANQSTQGPTCGTAIVVVRPDALLIAELTPLTSVLRDLVLHALIALLVFAQFN